MCGGLRPKDGVCTQNPATKPTTVQMQRAVRQQMVQGQLDGSFRSIERAAEKHATRMRKTQNARCVRLLDSTQ